jgi:hypothetical protein
MFIHLFHQCRSQIERGSVAVSFFPVWRDSAVEEQKDLKHMSTELYRERFIQFCKDRQESERPIYEMLVALGFLEAVDAKAIKLVDEFVADQIKAELRAAREHFSKRDLTNLCFDELIEILDRALRTISDRLLVSGTKSIECVASEFAKYAELDLSWVKEIAAVLVEAVFTKVASLVTRRSLRRQCFEDIRDLFRVAIGFGNRQEIVVIDRGFLEKTVMNYWRSLIERFTKEYSARLDRALNAEEWEWTPDAPWEHIEILRELSGSKTTSFKLNGGTYDSSPPVLILLEFIGEYLEMAQKMTCLIDGITVTLFLGIRFFVSGSSKELLQRKCPTTLRTLAISAFGLHFCFHLVPLIKSKLISASAPRDLVEKASLDVTTELKESYDAVVKGIESMHINTAQTEITDEVRTIDWLRALARGSLSARIRAEGLGPRDGLKETTNSSGASLVSSGPPFYEKDGSP